MNADQITNRELTNSKAQIINNSASPRLRGEFAVRLGLRYAKGLREEAAQALVRARKDAPPVSQSEGVGDCLPYFSIDDLALRVPELRKNELVLLAEIGALNNVSGFTFHVSSEDNCPVHNSGHLKLETRNLKLHRRDALWQVERATRKAGPILEGIVEADAPSPLQPMNAEERLVADFRGTGLTVGPHPMAYRRAQMERMGVRCAADLPHLPNGRRTRIAGSVIARQRPGTASGFVFLSLGDETGIANAIVNPDLFEQNRLMLVAERFLMVEGVLQNQDNVISVKADRVLPLQVSEAEMTSHDFH